MFVLPPSTKFTAVQGSSVSQMASTVGGPGSGEPDMVLVSELLEAISRSPPAVGARKLLVEHYISIGWLDAAMENATELKKLAPNDSEVTEFIAILSKRPAPFVPLKSTPRKTVPPAPPPKPEAKPKKKPVPLSGSKESAMEDFAQGYTTLRQKAKFLLSDLLLLQAFQKKRGLPQSKNTARIQAIAENGAPGAAASNPPPSSARSVARVIQDSPQRATELAIADLEETMTWHRAPYGKPSGVDDDAVRETLAKRVTALENALPENLKFHSEIAFMHIQHEHLGKAYVNDETMLGDEVKDIPRENFWVTEDNYAWDMTELAQAIAVGGGIMRNPLSKQMFTPKDIRGIVNHPAGSGLRALQVQQHEMAKGVRPDTITQMEKLASVLLEDQSSDALASRHAVDEFLAYIATLPDLEQQALDRLKCAAKDSHTGQAYDFTVGEAVRDAKGNRVCFHKTGDFLKQAAVFLGQNRGAPPDPDQNRGVM